MNILITGGAGYIGSHTVRRLAGQKHNVLVLDNLSKGHRAAVSGVKLVVGDTADRALLKNIFSQYKIDAVIHFAASSLVGESAKAPSPYYQNNVVGGLSLLDAMVEAGVKYLIFSSTAAVYGEPLEVPIPEDHPASPVNPYGVTRQVGDGSFLACHFIVEMMLS